MMTGPRECFAGECVRDVTGWPSGWQMVIIAAVWMGALLAFRSSRD